MRSSVMNQCIEIKHICKSYTKTNETILNNIHLIIYENEFVSIGGASGSGKSTLLRILALIDPHFEGEYKYQNKKINQSDEKALNNFRKNTLGIVFQDYNLIDRYTIYRNLEFALITQKVAPQKRKDKMIQALKKVNLKQDILNRTPQELSGGQKQRVAIARTLLSNPKIIVADEPTGSLDDTNAMEIMDLFLSLKITLIIATHDTRISKMSHRHVHVENGKIYVT